MSFFPSGGHAGDDPDDGLGSPELDADFPLGDGTVESDAEVTCPYCLEPVTIALDPGSGSRQSYVEDCYVCCRPWNVHVSYDGVGGAEVRVDAADEGDGE